MFVDYVAATLQTLFLSEDLMLCDCPGLVFPSFLSSKAEMVCSGILPIDQLRDHIAPVSLVCERIPRPVLEGMYGITLPLPGEGEDPQRPPGAHELLSAYGCESTTGCPAPWWLMMHFLCGCGCGQAGEGT